MARWVTRSRVVPAKGGATSTATAAATSASATTDTGVGAADENPPVTAVPPPEVLARLRRTIERGEFGELERELNEHAGDTCYAGFCRQIRQLAARYDDEGISALLDGLEKDHDDDGNQ